MRIRHVLDNDSVEQETSEDVGFLLTNKSGGFLNLGVPTRYRGLHFEVADVLYKVIDAITIDGQIDSLENHFWNIQRHTAENSESFFLPFGTNSLVYELKQKAAVKICFDVKKPYDNRNWGRNFHVFEENGTIIVHFVKTTDYREDPSQGETEFELYLAIKADGNATLLDGWSKEEYAFDRKRGSAPFERHTYHGLDLDTSGFVIGCGASKDEAVLLCKSIFADKEKYKETQHQFSALSIRGNSDTTLRIAEKAAMESLDHLTVKQQHIYAGLPWFFQFWGRDTFISLKALMIDREFSTAKSILMHHLDFIDDEGLLPNHLSNAQLRSIDAIGWYVKRWEDLFSLLIDENIVETYLSEAEVNKVTSVLQKAILAIENQTEHGLLPNYSQETWMDTIYKCGREGIRIEVQALFLVFYRLLFKITHKEEYKGKMDILKERIKNLFWTGTTLLDGIDDERVRPNVFLAYYLAPEILDDNQWESCFDHCLERLWLDWGGIATIDVSDESFHPESTGEDSSSYHHGDSWYWVNNLVALCMIRLNQSKYQDKIDAIIHASTSDILYKGYLGCHSEVSGASSQAALGCLSQAWSNALFVELCEELSNQWGDEDF